MDQQTDLPKTNYMLIKDSMMSNLSHSSVEVRIDASS